MLCLSYLSYTFPDEHLWHSSVADAPSVFGGFDLLLIQDEEATMFVTIAVYLVRSGEEDAFLALHENWQDKQQPRRPGVLSAVLLKNTANTRQFISIMHFEREEFALALENDAEHSSWLQRLTSLAEVTPAHYRYTCEWSLTV